MARTAIVIGGGLLGVTNAWYLTERGFEVTLVERRDDTALETSFANGGLVTPSQSDPWNGPGTFGHLLKWLWREDSPLLLRPRALPGLWRWGLRFLWASRAAPWWSATEANLRLGLYSLECLRALRGAVRVDYDGLRAGTLKVFRDAAAFERSAALARALAPLGLKHRSLTGSDAAALEPWLAPVASKLAGAIHYPEDESGDAHRFAQVLADNTRRRGVRYLFGTAAAGFAASGGKVAALRTTKGELQGDIYILAAASATPGLVASLGLKLLIYPVKGYSLTLPMPQIERSLGVPLVDFEQKVVITPMGKRLRIAGTAEFAGFDLSLNSRRYGAILGHVQRLLPQLADSESDVQPWTGLRPMTVDGPPILGATRYANLFLNAGHGPLGWTLAAGSSRAVADLAAGRTPEIDLAPYSAARFA